VALDWSPRQGHAAVVVGLGDTPGLTVSGWRTVAEATGGPIVIATYAGKRGHPVRLDAAVWTLLPTSGDEGARSLMSRRPELVVEVACEGKATDIDTREDLRRWS
jgi:CTP:molybdopterin cytidylyltransferase MocA